MEHAALFSASTSNDHGRSQGGGGKKVWYKNIPRDSVMRMIELIKERNVLYDPSHPNYNANHYRNVMYKKISEQLISEGHLDNNHQFIEVQDVWLSLRRKFVRENTRPPTPDGTIREPDFEYYEALKFLNDYQSQTKEKPEGAPKKPSFSRKRPKPAEKYASPNDAYAAGVDEADFYANFRFSLDQSNGSNNWMESLNENKLPKWEDLDGVDEETPSMEAASESSNAYLNNLVQRATREERARSTNKADIIAVEPSTFTTSTTNGQSLDQTTKALGQNVMEMYSSLKNENCLRQAADFRKKIHDLIYEYDIYLAEKRANS